MARRFDRDHAWPILEMSTHTNARSAPHAHMPAMPDRASSDRLQLPLRKILLARLPALLAGDSTATLALRCCDRRWRARLETCCGCCGCVALRAWRAHARAARLVGPDRQPSEAFLRDFCEERDAQRLNGDLGGGVTLMSLQTGCSTRSPCGRGGCGACAAGRGAIPQPPRLPPHLSPYIVRMQRREARCAPVAGTTGAALTGNAALSEGAAPGSAPVCARATPRRRSATAARIVSERSKARRALLWGFDIILM